MIRFDGPELLTLRRQPHRAGWGPASPRSRTGSTSLAGPPHRLMRDAGVGSLAGVFLVVAVMAADQILRWLLAQLGDWWLLVGAGVGRCGDGDTVTEPTLTLTPHAFVRLDGSPQMVVFDLGDEADRRAFLDEIVEGHDWGAGSGNYADDGEAWLTVEVRPMPSGYAAGLPEFGGW